MEENEKTRNFTCDPEAEQTGQVELPEESVEETAAEIAEEAEVMLPAEDLPVPEETADEPESGELAGETPAETAREKQPSAAPPVSRPSAQEEAEAKKKQEEIRKRRATRKQSESHKKKRMRRILLLVTVLLIAFVFLVTSLINLVRVLFRGKSENIGPLPSEEVVVHKVPVYYDYEAPVPDAAAVSDSYFSDAILIGDTRVQCLDLYGVGNFKTLLYGTSINVNNALSYDCRSSDGTDGSPNEKLQLNRYGKIYLTFGINELGWNNPDTFATNLRQLVEQVQSMQPDAIVYVLGLMPVSENRDGKTEYITNERIKKYNILIQTVATDTGTYYLDCYEGVADEAGYLPSEQTSDGINLLEEGCQVWYNYMKTHTVNPEDYSN